MAFYIIHVTQLAIRKCRRDLSSRRAVKRSRSHTDFPQSDSIESEHIIMIMT